MDLTALSAELTLDPAGLGYVGPDSEDAEKLNAPSPGGETVFRKAIPMSEIYAQIEWISEWAALPGVMRDGFRQLTSTDALDVTSPRVRAAMEGIFGAGSQTWANLASIATRPASRAEILWGEGTRVHHLDVAAARRLV